MKAPPSPLRIFLVENHEDTLRYMKMYLELLGHRVDFARDVESALAQIEPLEIDLLLSDIGLPDGDGWQLLERISAARPIFAVAMSGFGMRADREKSRAAGYRHHLIKPFMPEDLAPILAEAAAAREPKGESSES